jgi:C-terminal processing protease CtpA/Prc
VQDSRTYVDTIVPGFAADLCGRFYEGDEVTAIDGVDVSTYSLNAIKRLTNGDEGTSVRLEMRREGLDPFAVTLTRRSPSFRDGRNSNAASKIVSDF